MHRLTLGLLVVYAVWAIMLFDLQFFLGIKVHPALGRLANYAFVPLLGLVALRGLTFEAGKSWVWYPPFLLLMSAGLGSLPVLSNTWMAWLTMQILLSYYVLAVATAMFVETPRQALPILAMIVLRFLWWGLWAGTSGKVVWDPSMMNEDGFGGLMVQGAAICFWFGMAVKIRWQKWLMFGLAAYSILGVVASVARGAFLALVIVALLIWARSPRKLLTGAGVLIGLVIVVAAASLLFEPGQNLRSYRPGDSFWDQIMSAFSEGTEEGTGAHRWALWTAATKVWLTHPIFGVGPNNFGVFASEYFQPGEIPGFENVGMLWGLNLHSAYFQILSEFGLVGVAAFTWIMVDFLKKNRALRSPDAKARWAALGMASKLDLHAVSLALESGLVACALVNIVYASFFEPWFISMWAINRTLWGLTRSVSQPVRSAARMRTPASLAHRGGVA